MEDTQSNQLMKDTTTQQTIEPPSPQSPHLIHAEGMSILPGAGYTVVDRNGCLFAHTYSGYDARAIASLPLLIKAAKYARENLENMTDDEQALFDAALAFENHTQKPAPAIQP